MTLPVPRVARRVLAYGRDTLALDRDDVLVASYPKSGSTWVRFMLAYLAAVRDGDDRPIDYVRLDARLPEFGRGELGRAEPVGRLPRFVKTHRAWWRPFGGRRAVLVTRDPRDTMVSFYQFEQGKTDPRYEGDFAGFIRHPQVGLDAWFRHTRDWRAHGPVEVRYEDLKADDVAAFGAVCRALALPVSQDEVREAAERSRFDRVKSLEKSMGLPQPDKVKEGFEFAKSGTVGRGERWFSDADDALFESKAEEYGFRR